MRLHPLGSLALGALLLAAACTEPNPAFVAPGRDGGPRFDLPPGVDARVGDGLPAGDGPTADAPRPPSRAAGVDVLFVVDNSPGMGAPQQRLGRAMGPLLLALEGLPGRPSYRIGVVSTDLGAGGYANRSCPKPNGDGGELLLRPGCPKPSGGVKYVERLGETVNVEGALELALACLVRLGEEGCGFEQPLESLRTALTSANPGFLRPEAALAVVVLGNEDDCSAANAELYNPDAELGQYGSYRCFRHGVLCDGAAPPAGPGSVQNCVPGQDWLHPVIGRYVDPLAALKPPGWVSVIVLSGVPPQRIEIVQEQTSRGAVVRLDTICVSEDSYAEPAVRLFAFAAAFGGQGRFESICAESYREALAQGIARLQAAF